MKFNATRLPEELIAVVNTFYSSKKRRSLDRSRKLPKAHNFCTGWVRRKIRPKRKPVDPDDEPIQRNKKAKEEGKT